MSVGTMPCWEVVPLGLALKVYWHGSSPTWRFLHHAQLCEAAAEDLPSNPGQPAAVLKTHGFAGDPLLIWLLYSLYKINNLLLMVEVHRASEVSLKELGGAFLPSSGFWIDFFFKISLSAANTDISVRCTKIEWRKYRTLKFSMEVKVQTST